MSTSQYFQYTDSTDTWRFFKCNCYVWKKKQKKFTNISMNHWGYQSVLKSRLGLQVRSLSIYIKITCHIVRWCRAQKKKSNPEHCLDFALLDNNLLCTYAYNYFLVTLRMRGVIYFNLHSPYGFVSSLLRSLYKYFIFRHGILKLTIRNLESNLSLECRMCHCLSSLHIL